MVSNAEFLLEGAAIEIDNEIADLINGPSGENRRPLSANLGKSGGADGACLFENGSSTARLEAVDQAATVCR